MLTARPFFYIRLRGFPLFTRSLELRGKTDASLDDSRQWTHWRTESLSRERAGEMMLPEKDACKNYIHQLCYIGVLIPGHTAMGVAVEKIKHPSYTKTPKSCASIDSICTIHHCKATTLITSQKPDHYRK